MGGKESLGEFRHSVRMCVDRGHLQPWFGEKVDRLIDVAKVAAEYVDELDTSGMAEDDALRAALEKLGV